MLTNDCHNYTEILFFERYWVFVYQVVSWCRVVVYSSIVSWWEWGLHASSSRGTLALWNFDWIYFSFKGLVFYNQTRQAIRQANYMSRRASYTKYWVSIKRAIFPRMIILSMKCFHYNYYYLKTKSKLIELA